MWDLQCPVRPTHPPFALGSSSSAAGRLCPFAARPAGSATGAARCQDSLQCLAGRGGSSEVAEGARSPFVMVIRHARRFPTPRSAPRSPAGLRPRRQGSGRCAPIYVLKSIGWTISRAVLCPVVPARRDWRQSEGRVAGHSCPGYRSLRNASKRSSGRYRPGLPLGGMVLSSTCSFNARSASR